MFPLSQLRIFTEPQQGATYDDLLAVALRAQELGFGAFFRSDHFLAMGRQADDGGLPGPTDAWTTLAGLARDTATHGSGTIRLGTLVTSATFRHPGVLAVQVAGVDQMSAGRVELGIGAGWFQAEHDACAVPFPPVGERFDRLEEQLAVITGLWETPVGERFNFAGEHFRVVDSPGLPKPVQDGGIPIVVGGRGAKRTPALAARYATEFNTPFLSIDDFRTMRQRVMAACDAVDRDPATITFSAALVVAVGGDEQELARRVTAADLGSDELRTKAIAGTLDEAAARLHDWRDAGAERIYLQVLDLNDLDHLDTIAALAPNMS